MKTCVTGANGFVGSNLCAALTKAGHAVCATVRRTSDRRFLAALNDVKIFEADITQPETLEAPFQGCEVVFHVAALTSDWGDWELFKKINIDGVRNVIEVARNCHVRRVVHLSSVSVYGFPNAQNIDEDAPWVERKGDPYITSKQAGEQLALSFHGKGIEVVALRPGGIYGPNDRTTTLKLFPEIARGRFPLIDGGRYLMGPTYIDNLTDAAWLAATKPGIGGQAYNIVDDGRITWRKYVEYACDDLKCRKPRLSLPSRLVWPVACAAEGVGKFFHLRESPWINKYRARAVIGDAHYSHLKARRELGYVPRVSTREGISRTARWYLDFTTGTEGRAS